MRACSELKDADIGLWEGYYDPRTDDLFFEPPMHKALELESAAEFFAHSAAGSECLQEIADTIGTHALFEPGVEFRELGLVVVDEQHRFGVMQRAALAQKGTRPDVLVMTATPIPRTAAMTVYGDLDVSILDEMLAEPNTSN